MAAVLAGLVAVACAGSPDSTGLSGLGAFGTGGDTALPPEFGSTSAESAEDGTHGQSTGDHGTGDHGTGDHGTGDHGLGDHGTGGTSPDEPADTEDATDGMVGTGESRDDTTGPGMTGTGAGESGPAGTTDDGAGPCEQPPGAMTPGQLGEASVGTPYDVVLSGPDGEYPYDWFTLGTLPPGLAFAVDGQPNPQASVSGTPTEVGEFEFIVIANPTGEDCVNADALIVTYTLGVGP